MRHQKDRKRERNTRLGGGFESDYNEKVWCPIPVVVLLLSFIPLLIPLEYIVAVVVSIGVFQGYVLVRDVYKGLNATTLLPLQDKMTAFFFFFFFFFFVCVLKEYQIFFF